MLRLRPRLRVLAGLALAATAAGCGAEPPATPPERRPRVEDAGARDALPAQTPATGPDAGSESATAAIERAGCRATLSWQNRSLRLDLHASAGVLAPCPPVPASDRAGLLGELLPRALAEHPTPSGFFWPGLHADYPEFAERLARAALSSPRWDPLAGRPRRERDHLHDLVVELANDAHAAREIEAVFARHGLTLRLQSVEKVFDEVVGGEQDSTRAISERLLAAGLRRGWRWPLPSILWFRLARATEVGAPEAGGAATEAPNVARLIVQMQVFAADAFGAHGVRSCFRIIADIRDRHPDQRPAAIFAEISDRRLRIPYVANEADTYVSQCTPIDWLGSTEDVRVRFTARYGATSVDETYVFPRTVPEHGFVDVPPARR